MTDWWQQTSSSQSQMPEIMYVDSEIQLFLTIDAARAESEWYPDKGPFSFFICTNVAYSSGWYIVRMEGLNKNQAHK